MGRFVILVLAVATHMSGWAVASDNFAGTWTGTVNGQPGVTLRIENPKASHCGEATLYTQANDNGTWRVAGALTQPVTSCTTNGNVLVFRTKYYASRGSSDLVEQKYRISVESMSTAVLRSSSGNMRAHPIRLERK